MRYICVCLMLLVMLVFLPNEAVAIDIVATRGSIMVEGIQDPVFVKNGDILHAPASLTKVMTVILALGLGDLQEEVTVSPRAVASGGGSLNLNPGSTHTLQDLLYATLLVSANDAAAAVAEHIGGSIEGFADLMNEQARKLGMMNTHFRNPHGMPDARQVSTANDLALLGLAASRSPQFVEIASTPRYVMQGGRVLSNQNKLLGEFQGMIFGKTGYTHAAGQCFIAVAESGGLKVVTVILGSQGVNIWSDTEALLNHALRSYRRTIFVHNRQTIGTIRIPLAGEVLLVSTRDFALVTPEGQRHAVEIEVYPYPGLLPPLKPGDILGEALIRVGERVEVIPLTIAYPIPLLTPEVTRGVYVGLIIMLLAGLNKLRRLKR